MFEAENVADLIARPKHIVNVFFGMRGAHAETHS